MRELNGEKLNGYYLYDEEGVKAQRVPLVEKGVLRSDLLSRQPVEGFLQSNGHGRSQGSSRPVARMANRIVDSGRKQGVFNGFCGAESGMVPVSTVAPAMLLQEIELQRTMEGKDRSPILTSPAVASMPEAKKQE